jgi:hypothetical protein
MRLPERTVRVTRRPLIIVLLVLCGLLGAAIARAADPTDSIVTYGCDPPLPRSAANCSLWHTVPVTVRWTIVDPNYVPVGNSCDSKTISADTTGTNVTCTVQSSSGTVSRTATVFVDQTPPTVNAGLPQRAPDSNGWWNHPIQFNFSGTDATSKIDSCDTPTYSGPDAASGSVTGACRDKAGNSASRQVTGIKYDSKPPTGIGAKADREPDHDGWYNHPVTVSFSGTDATSGIEGCDSVAYDGPDSPTANVHGGCRDKAGNPASGDFGLKYDGTPPTLNSLPPEVGSNQVALHWTASADTVSTQIIRSPGIGTAAASMVYSGASQSFTDPGVSNGVTYTYSINVSDVAGNVARSTVTVTPVGAPPPPAPTIKKAVKLPLLKWRRVKRSDYYNVQLYRGKRKILSTWVKANHFQLRSSWVFKGKRMQLTDARYDWYAWPGFGRRSLRRYGHLITHQKFTFTTTAY